MKTVGEILSNARQEKELTLQQVSKYTRIGVRYLKAIEANKFNQLPSTTFTKGFLKNYARVVGVKPDQVLAIFRRDYDQDSRGNIIPRGLSKPIKASNFMFNPTTTAIAVASAVSVLIVSFFGHQVYQYLSAPSLTISNPPQAAEVAPTFLVEGKTDPQASVTINNRSVLIDEAGNFSSEITLAEGKHLLIVKATSRSEKETTLQHQVTVIDN